MNWSNLGVNREEGGLREAIAAYGADSELPAKKAQPPPSANCGTCGWFLRSFCNQLSRERRAAELTFVRTLRVRIHDGTAISS